MRNAMLLILAAALVACSPPAQQDTSQAPEPTPPAVVACNDVAPDVANAVPVRDEVVAAAAVADLRGGRITPGIYDLVSATRIGQATGWQGERAVALQVDESEGGGVVFNWAGAAENEVDRWTANFTEAPTPSLTYTCGRMGTIGANFRAEENQLQLRLPDGANGALALVFARRS